MRARGDLAALSAAVDAVLAARGLDKNAFEGWAADGHVQIRPVS